MKPMKTHRLLDFSRCQACTTAALNYIDVAKGVASIYSDVDLLVALGVKMTYTMMVIFKT